MKKILIILIFLFAFQTEASFMILDSSGDNLGLNEQFYVDLLLDPEGTSINGIEGNITFPSEYLSFVRAEDGKSMISLWVQPPILSNNTIKFTGLIPNGFEGVIDPFNQSHKLPGLIVRFVFEAIRPGEVSITTPVFTISLNDGLGTIKKIPATNTSISISDKKNQVSYESENNIPPEIEAHITKNPDLFNNKYTLIFNAIDKNSGIKEVLIKEGNRDWKVIKSPYLLEDQTRHSIIALQAVNYYGQSVVVTIDPISYEFSFVDFVAIFILLVILFFVIKKRYVNKK